MGELTGKVAIVTGASKGIGAAIAKTFAEAGAAVTVNYASNKADADRVVGEMVKASGKAIAIQADVAKRADVKRLFAETAEKLGRPSILVNNAGVYSFAPLEQNDVEVDQKTEPAPIMPRPTCAVLRQALSRVFPYGAGRAIRKNLANPSALDPHDP